MWSLEFFIWCFVFSLGGLLVTHFLNHRLNQGSVRASALSSLIVGLIFHLIPDMFDPMLQQSLPLVFIGASFIGMSNTQHFSSFPKFVMAALIFSTLYIGSNEIFQGYGGKLGLMANISVVAVIGLFSMLSRRSEKSI